MCGTE
jgi:hypothetical protein